MIKDKIGNTELLNLNKTAFLCSRKIEAAAVLKSLDWATDMRDRGECIISGFHSKIEKDVLMLSNYMRSVLSIIPHMQMLIICWVF